MVQSTNRALREDLFNGYRLRASEGERDNGPIAIKIAQLRAERATLMGYESHAHYVLEYNMAKTPAGAEDFLLRVWRPGLAQAKRERADMQDLMGETTFAAWDWWHLAEKLRLARYDLDETQPSRISSSKTSNKALLPWQTSYSAYPSNKLMSRAGTRSWFHSM